MVSSSGGRGGAGGGGRGVGTAGWGRGVTTECPGAPRSWAWALKCPVTELEEVMSIHLVFLLPRSDE